MPTTQAPNLSRLVRGSGYTAVALALAAVVLTFFLLMGLTPIAPTPEVVQIAVAVNGVLIAYLIFLVAWEVAGLIRARRRGRAGAQLHIRIVALFSIIAVTPAILVALGASVTLNRGLDHWFSTRTKAIVDNSLSIAEAYVQEHARTLQAELLTLKPELERARSLFEADRPRFQTYLDSVAATRGLPGVFLIDGSGSAVVTANTRIQQQWPPAPPDAVRDAAGNGSQPVLIAPGKTNLIGGIVRLEGYSELLLYLIRPVDPTVVQYTGMIRDTVAEYGNLEATRLGVQVAFALLYLGVSLVLMLSAIWIAIAFANRLVAPIRRLIGAADEVSRGNLAVDVPIGRSDGDMGALSATFNKMTLQLRSQRGALLAASEQIDSRRRFTEAVLSGVTAGVVGIDQQDDVTIVNRSALALLGVDQENAVGRPLHEVAPELVGVLAEAKGDDRREHRDQITLVRGGRERTVNVRITNEESSSGSHGYVVTLDDITDLVAAQRTSAWADVARRIAHEIKNPLTPIQLSAERLRRRFGKVVGDDREIFDQCTDTIIRQVGDIGRMVDEFSSFARMPKPTMETQNLNDTVREAVFLMQVGYSEIQFVTDLPDEPLISRFDPRLLSQAFTNLLKNAAEAVAAVPPDRRGQGRVTVTGRKLGNSILVGIADNGIGLPAEQRHRLLEPYMTTREKGTGLGLAIVAKIIEDHHGRIELLDAPPDDDGRIGALIRIVLPQAEAAEEASEPDDRTASEAASSQYVNASQTAK